MPDHNTNKRQIYTKVYSGHAFEIPSGFKEAVEWFQEKLNQIPVECRDEAYWDVSNGSHDGSPVIEIIYTRLETDEEFQVRFQQHRSQEQLEREKEIQLLHTLKSKYPGE